MISYWGGHEISQRRRVKLLQDVNGLLNQRLGYDHAIVINMERVLNFFDAKSRILVIQRPSLPSTYRPYCLSHSRTTLEDTRASSSAKHESINTHTMNDEVAKIFLNLPDSLPISYNKVAAWWKRYVPERFLPEQDSSLRTELGMLANMLDTQCFLTVPYRQQAGSRGRLYLIPQKNTFSQSNLDFVAQLLVSISHAIENIQLIDKSVSSSAKHERFKISLDIHDRTIQPYIGLKLGLDALKAGWVKQSAGQGNQRAAMHD